MPLILKLPESAVKGGKIIGTFEITGDDAELLKKEGSVAVELECGIYQHKILFPSLVTGDPAQSCLPLKEICRKKLGFGKNLEGRFEFDLDRELLPTYYGKLFDLKHFVKLKLDLSLKFDKQASKEVVVK